MTPSNILTRAWESYVHKCIPHRAPRLQIRETKKSFYAGAASALFGLVVDLEDGQGVSKADEDLVASLFDEIERFKRSAESR